MAADVLKRQPLGDERHRLGMATINLGHVPLQINGKGVFFHLEIVDAPVGFDETPVPAKVVAP